MTLSLHSLDIVLAAGAIVFATLGWLYAAREQRRLARRSHTFDVLLSSDITGELAELLDEVDNRARSADPLRATDVDTIDSAFRRALNFHEFICAAIRDNTLDERLIRNTLRTRMLRLYDFSRDFIAELRLRRRNPEAMEHFEWFAIHRLHYERWKQQVGATSRGDAK
ncbi:MAG: DUF4760 domain-containing protein [Alphaproteobacteria bacterium]|nr:DUF4760 domain-containing protein [Alphaproteobacteria bacterium]